MLSCTLARIVLFGASRGLLESNATLIKAQSQCESAQRGGLSRCWANFHTKSLAEAARRPKDVEVLDLNASPELLCHNLLCEKVGDPCICRISVVLEKLTKLRSLNLANNRLVSLPPSIWDLETLEELDLSGNLLEGVPEDIRKLSKLRRLNLDRNPLPEGSLPTGLPGNKPVFERH
ncbi:hypothetical protein KFL_007410040 [Klebsormidium nitens]|uniref:Uncharacterized protein n=1 Tax=Klebsormidium nitens TaxID=105231 RepID=A0A1Y1IK98_KLENI|nr:hypothetical protein KFL_007410040 [Klebsormidium nitens]|eukprot:GAQ91194.1 hypothetical protein KFL_007410040 [Klebsormidium nitens]